VCLAPPDIRCDLVLKVIAVLGEQLGRSGLEGLSAVQTSGLVMDSEFFKMLTVGLPRTNEGFPAVIRRCRKISSGEQPLSEGGVVTLKLA
jgi:hypothetical protein